MAEDNSAASTPAASATPEAVDRRVGVGLILGILLAPVVFAWFLLRQGYSTAVRLAGFGWLAFTMLIVIWSNTPQVSINGAAPAASSLAAAPAEAPPAKIGSVIQIGPVAFTFEEPIIRSSVGMQGFQQKASQGGVLVVVRYTIKNITDKPVEAYAIPDISLVDPHGVTYGPDAGKEGYYAMETDLDQKAWSNLNPGITTQSAHVFEIAKDSFDPTTWKIVIGEHAAEVAMTK